MNNPFLRESLLAEQSDHKLRCNICERRCLLGVGAFGWCRTRQNIAGRLIALNYGATAALAADPIEKKPFYHFHPGTMVFTAGGWSCNFGCPWCQNWQIAHVKPPSDSTYTSPVHFVAMAETKGCKGVAISYNEPTLALEWSLDVFRLAKARGLYTAYVTNGYMTPEALALLVEAGLEAINVDVKGDAPAVWKYCKGVTLERVWENCRLARASGVHIEITTLVIPGVNDSDAALGEIAERIAHDLAPSVPWHVSGYYPAYRFTAPPTPVQTLERAWQIGKDAGLEYVYVGNVPGHAGDHTLCPECNTLLVQRSGYVVQHNLLRGGRCPRCGRVVAGVWAGVGDKAAVTGHEERMP